MTLYDRLRKKEKIYCMGKHPSVLKAACRYIDGIMKRKEYKNQRIIAEQFDISEIALRKRAKEIMRLLKLTPTFFDKKCIYCGGKIQEKIKYNHNAKWCSKCRKIRNLCEKWEKASICICCGELNPLILLPTGHHLLGRDNSDITIPICANCHELTKSRKRQGFFLFNNWKPPKARFTEDNSKIYISIP